MKKTTLNKLMIALCAIAVLASCKAKKLAEKSPAKTDSAAVTTNNSSAEKLKAFSAAQGNYKTFSGRAKARLGINGKDNDVTMNLRIASGQKIWASVTAIAGIEVARALITPDSIRVINRLEGKYIAKPFSFVHSYSSDQVDFAMLESILVGNYISKFVNEKSKLDPKPDNQIQISGQAADLMYNIIFGTNAKPMTETLTNQAKGQSLEISNDKFMDVSGRVFPANIRIDSKVKEKAIQLILNYTKIELDQNLQYPFTVSARYTRAD